MDNEINLNQLTGTVWIREAAKMLMEAVTDTDDLTPEEVFADADFQDSLMLTLHYIMEVTKQIEDPTYTV